MTNTRGSYKMNKNTWRSSPIFLKILVNHCQPIHVHRKASDFLEPPKSRCIFHPSNWTIVSSVQNAQQKRRLESLVSEGFQGLKKPQHCMKFDGVWNESMNKHTSSSFNQVYSTYVTSSLHPYLSQIHLQWKRLEPHRNWWRIKVSDVGNGFFWFGFHPCQISGW